MVRLFVICFTLMAASVVNCAEVDAVRQLQENYVSSKLLTFPFGIYCQSVSDSHLFLLFPF